MIKLKTTKEIHGLWYTGKYDSVLWLSEEDHQEEIRKAVYKGYRKALDNNNILHGKNAKRFLKESGLDKLSH